jgi:hypothetical protein
VGRNPFLWHYARVDGALPAAPAASARRLPTPSRAARRPAPPAPDTWRILEAYAAIAPRTLPLAEHLRRWRQQATAAPTCPACNAQMRERRGSFGRFWGCIRYPACTGTISID